ncbi:hypothetical protein AAG570_003630 [Ranatra chinensis]|uniref:THUMP domain-containing protein n=1 Tax=Ranatra chinensis TaxID=642074 RepID=A0ABD0Y491_9HEMI
MEAARDFGGALQDKFHWTVDLSHYDLEVVLNIASDAAYVCAALTKESLHKRNITHFGSTTLRATMCYNLLRLAEPIKGDVVIDPLGGGGSIPIESCLAFPYTFNLCGDMDEKAVNRSKCNLDYLREKHPMAMDILRWNTLKLPLVDQSVDVFVTDLPFGKRSGKKKDNRGLYRGVLNELGRVVRMKSGRAVILTGDKAAFLQALGMNHPYWKKIRMFGVNQGGMFSAVFLLLRTSKQFMKL